MCFFLFAPFFFILFNIEEWTITSFHTFFSCYVRKSNKIWTRCDFFRSPLYVWVRICVLSFVYHCHTYMFMYQFKIKCNWFYFDMSFNHSSEKITKVQYTLKVINVISSLNSTFTGCYSLTVLYKQWFNWRHIFFIS